MRLTKGGQSSLVMQPLCHQAMPVLRIVSGNISESHKQSSKRVLQATGFPSYQERSPQLENNFTETADTDLEDY